MPTNTAKERQIDTRNILTRVASVLYYKLDMARLSRIIGDMKTQIAQDSKRVSAIYKELASLREAYNRFRDLTEELQSREARLKTTLALMQNTLTTEEEAEILKESMFEVDMDADTEEALRERLTLWEAIVEILRQVPEAQVAEVCNILTFFEVKSSRQAVESAIETHKDRFRVTRRGREKFVALKE